MDEIATEEKSVTDVADININSNSLQNANNAKTKPKGRKRDDNEDRLYEHKFLALKKKYDQQCEENKTLQTCVKNYEKQATTLNKEKSQLLNDLTKTMNTKHRLENLCRELQRQNKTIKEESMEIIKEEENRCKEVQQKFETSLKDIAETMKQDNENSIKLRDDNIQLSNRLKMVCQEYEARERQIETMTKQLSLESDLYEAKISKLEMEWNLEKETMLREKQALLLKITEYQERIKQLQINEITLREQVELYNLKYGEFESSLQRSNATFKQFNSEMTHMKSKITNLEGESSIWKLNWMKKKEELEQVLVEKQNLEHRVMHTARQMNTLQNLCRTLQQDRTKMMVLLKQHGLSIDSRRGTPIEFDDKGNIVTASAKPADTKPNEDVIVANGIVKNERAEETADRVDDTLVVDIKSENGSVVDDKKVVDIKSENKNVVDDTAIVDTKSENESVPRLSEIVTVPINGFKESSQDSSIKSKIVRKKKKSKH